MTKTPVELGINVVHGAIYRFFQGLPTIRANAARAKRSYVYWLTYNLPKTLAPESQLASVLRELCAKHLHLRVIAASPTKYQFTSENLSNLQQRMEDCLGADAFEIRQYPRPGQGQADGVHLAPQHSKLILCDHPSSKTVVVGSFNMTESALTRNLELAAILRDSHFDLVQLQESVKRIWKIETEEITEEDCHPGPFRRRTKTSGEQTSSRQLLGAVHHHRHVDREEAPNEDEPEHPDDYLEVANPFVLRAFAETLDNMMSAWPPQASEESTQWTLFRELMWRQLAYEQQHPNTVIRDLLWLPPGVGKTYIALRWLSQKISDMYEEFGELKAGLFLTPNEWVAKSVENEISSICERADVDEEELTSLLQVKYASPASLEVNHLDIDDYAAFVADECHNWPTEGQRNYYSLITNQFLGKVSTLGLSATPCRMKASRFNTHEFITRFRNLQDGEAHPRVLNLARAIKRGFLSDYEIVPLFDDDDERVHEIRDLLAPDDTPVRLGDYSTVTLRHVWDEICGESRSSLADVAELISSKLDEYERDCVLVFLPGVGESGHHTAMDLVDVLQTQLDDTEWTHTVFLSSETNQSAARRIIKELREQTDKRQIIYSIDRFSEGISLPRIDALVMLRATLSPRVAVQQLGRGLRLHEDKDKLIVFDAVLTEDRINMFETGGAGLPRGIEAALHKLKRETERLIRQQFKGDATYVALTLLACAEPSGRTEILRQLEARFADKLDVTPEEAWNEFQEQRKDWERVEILSPFVLLPLPGGKTYFTAFGFFRRVVNSWPPGTPLRRSEIFALSGIEDHQTSTKWDAIRDLAIDKFALLQREPYAHNHYLGLGISPEDAMAIGDEDDWESEENEPEFVSYVRETLASHEPRSREEVLVSLVEDSKLFDLDSFNEAWKLVFLPIVASKGICPTKNNRYMFERRLIGENTVTHVVLGACRDLNARHNERAVRVAMSDIRERLSVRDQWYSDAVLRDTLKHLRDLELIEITGTRAGTRYRSL